jgi:hypothetical protein
MSLFSSKHYLLKNILDEAIGHAFLQPNEIKNSKQNINF